MAEGDGAVSRLGDRAHAAQHFEWQWDLVRAAIKVAKSYDAKIMLFSIGMATRYGTNGRNMYPGEPTLAQDFDISEKTARRWRKRACAAGYLRQVRRATGRSSAIYEISNEWRAIFEALVEGS